MNKSSIINHQSSMTKGFTLIELMIVVVILGMLATMIMPRILDKPERARRVKAQSEIRTLQQTLSLFNSDTGRFPTTSEGLQALVANPGNVDNYADKGYLDNVPSDPWGRPYIYICPGINGKDYDLESLGKDGEDGGAGDDADIESWNMSS